MSPTNQDGRKNNTSKGKWGEDVAEEYLRKKGYQIVSRNWRAERGDIDIIILKNNILSFVEVKSGSTEQYGAPELRITSSKKRQLYKLASIYLQQLDNKINEYDSFQFDVIIVDGFPEKYKVRHYENAFYL